LVLLGLTGTLKFDDIVIADNCLLGISAPIQMSSPKCGEGRRKEGYVLGP
jgi:hypothetical protein